MEKSKKYVLFLLLLFFTMPFDTIGQIKDVPVVKLFEKEYYKYEIKPKESLYSICKKFDVTEAELLSMNPFIADGLKAGQTLMIPVKDITGKKKEQEILVSNDPAVVKATVTEKARKIVPGISDKPRITILLPFAETSVSGANDKYIEFYEGLLLAVDSLKSLGISFDVQALESGEDAQGINHAIITGKLNETDYCIGGTTPEQIALLAKWAKTNQKILILPFSSRIPEMENNPYLFQTNTPHESMYDKLTDFTVDRIGKSNIVFLKTNVDIEDSRSALISQLKTKFKNKGIAYKEVTYNDNEEELSALAAVLVSSRENQIIPPPMTMNEVNRLVTRLASLSNTAPDKKIALMGYPDWQAMSKGYQKRLYELNTYIYSNFYADVQLQNVRDFQVRFTRSFGKNMLNSYPKYGMMGYDIATYFIPRMVFERSENMEIIPSIAPLQNDFVFDSKSPMSGSYNQTLYIINYNPDNTVKVIPLF